MKVVAIYPAFAPEINEMAMAWQRLTDAKLIECRVITGKDDRLKAAASAQGIERLPNLEILRRPGLVAGGQLDDAAVGWAAEFKPDLIFSALQKNIRHARRIAERSPAPILVHAEAWLNSTVMQRRLYLGIEPLRPLVAGAMRAWHRRHVDAVAFSNPTEIAALRDKADMHYLPWPHPRPLATPLRGRGARSLDTVVHVGFLCRWKGARRLGEYCEQLLRDDAQTRLVIVGPIGDRTARQAIDRLRGWRADGRFCHIERLPRAQAMELIARSLAVISPHPFGGWGLIGDSWAHGTPVIAVASHYDIEEGRNALVAPSPAGFVSAVRELRGGARLWQALSAQGQRTAEAQHGVDVVAGRLLELLRSTLQKCEGDQPRELREERCS